jgi:hypothetical protein
MGRKGAPIQELQRVERGAHVVAHALAQRAQHGALRAQALRGADLAQPRAQPLRLRA